MTEQNWGFLVMMIFMTIVYKINYTMNDSEDSSVTLEFCQEDIDLIIEGIGQTFEIKNWFNLDSEITLYLPYSITVTLDLDLCWCRIHRDWNLVRALEFKSDPTVLLDSIISVVTELK